MSLPILAMLATCALQGDYDPVWINKEGSSTDDLLFAAVSDSAQGAYVAGLTIGELPGPSLGFSDGIVRRIDGNGQTLWGRQLGTFGNDLMRCVGADVLGHVFVGGSSFDFNTAVMSEIFVARLDSGGSLDWQLQAGSAGTDVVTSVVPDGNGGCLAIGNTFGSFGGPNAGSTDIFVARIDAAGVLTGVTQFGTPLTDANPRAVSDGAGGYFLSFYTRGAYAAPSAGGLDVVLARFDAAGSQLWASQFGSSAHDEAWDLSRDGAGGVYVCGTTQGDLAGPHLGVKDIVVGRFDGAGNELFFIQEETLATTRAQASRGTPSRAVSTSPERTRMGTPSKRSATASCTSTPTRECSSRIEASVTTGLTPSSTCSPTEWAVRSSSGTRTAITAGPPKAKKISLRCGSRRT